ncbi:histone-lysine N-methyltransferase (Ash1), putative [Trichophyton verrucosum HKI 0517]|uniref:Histone-lysine N-methyltransferase (Ash1), putative n=1 Tax=Trichophyton verrucosum (strain HKI 0517) TaxID=663202 RepID=D4D4K2_TRIVH|nr:histone-lysine N-methyltransferase (Ash1), putative [Trichophyton verrucosum HKI 0517]EFE43204.1 histone-lysine N-methyltransferase (Ash1), putative [Trichophyton verrucosum HKI 0517]
MSRVARESTTSTSITPDSDSTLLDSTGHTLTPATSVSETSSNVDVPVTEPVSQTKPPQTRRVTRAASTRGGIDNDTEHNGNKHGDALRGDISASVSEGRTVVKREPARRPERRSLRGRRGLPAGALEPCEEETTAEIQLENTESNTGDEPIKEETGSRPQSSTKVDPAQPRRRSGRLTLLEKTKTVLNQVSSILGKRQRDDKEYSKSKSKVEDRRSSLRSRAVVRKETQEESATKKRRVSEDVSTPKKEKKVDQPPLSAPVQTVPKRKKWLTHGLYAGPNAFAKLELPGPQSKRKGTRQAPRERVLFPMPKYSGALLLEKGRPFRLPYDIFSPLPRGQPKPDEWRKINKNIFIGDAAGIWKATMPTEQSTCLCTPEMGCEENCQNRHMFYECDENNCKLGEDLCRNRNFSELRKRIKTGGKYNIGVEVIKTESRGYGVRSNRTFEPNQIIVEYTGEILTQIEAQRRMKTIYKKNECFYLMDFDQDMIIDATRGSIARFVNHSCEPNCKMEKWIVAGKPRIALFAGDNGIMTGEELTYDYNFDPYSNKNVQECRCGTPSCRGVLGPRPKGKDSKEKSTVKPASTRTKRKSQGVTNSQASKKQKTTKQSSVKSGLKRVASKASQGIKSQAKSIRVPKKRVGVQFNKSAKARTTAAADVSFKSVSRSSRTSRQAASSTKLRMPSRSRVRLAKTAVQTVLNGRGGRRTSARSR